MRNVLIFELESDEELMKVTVRPSGTEPKTKIYFEVEEEIISLKAAVENGAIKKDEAKKKIEDALLIFGADLIEKITGAFERKTGVLLSEFLKFME